MKRVKTLSGRQSVYSSFSEDVDPAQGEADLEAVSWESYDGNTSWITDTDRHTLSLAVRQRLHTCF